MKTCKIILRCQFTQNGLKRKSKEQLRGSEDSDHLLWRQHHQMAVFKCNRNCEKFKAEFFLPRFAFFISHNDKFIKICLLRLLTPVKNLPPIWRLQMVAQIIVCIHQKIFLHISSQNMICIDQAMCFQMSSPNGRD